MATSPVNSAGFYADFGKLDSLRVTAQKDPQAAVKAAAKQFEGIFMQMMLKCADLAHLSYDFCLHRAWVERLEEEMFRQGDREVTIGLPVSPLCDRTKQGITASQADFIDFVAMDMFKQFTDVFPSATSMLHGVMKNRAEWAHPCQKE